MEQESKEGLSKVRRVIFQYEKHTEDLNYDSALQELSDITKTPTNTENTLNEGAETTQENNKTNKEKEASNESPSGKIDKMNPYEQCDYKAIQKAHLNNHVKVIHAKIRNYFCPQCEYRASQKAHLATHMTRIHGIVNPSIQIESILASSQNDVDNDWTPENTMEVKSESIKNVVSEVTQDNNNISNEGNGKKAKSKEERPSSKGSEHVFGNNDKEQSEKVDEKKVYDDKLISQIVKNRLKRYPKSFKRTKI